MFQQNSSMIGNPLINLVIFFVIVLVMIVIFHPRIGVRRRLLSKAKKNKILREDILKYLIHREIENQKTSIEEVKNFLQKHTKYVFQQMERLEDDDLLVSENGMLQLTEEGRVYATRLIRSHRLVEKHLALNTGYDKKEWHEIAEKREHDYDDQSVLQLSRSLGNPLFDPHGDPIPSIDGMIVMPEGNPLAEFPVNVPAKIVHIEDEPKYIYEQLLKEEIHLGSELIIKKKSKNSTTFFCEGRTIKIPNIVANNLTVYPLPEGSVIDESVFRLSELKEDAEVSIVGISSECVGSKRRRLLDLGFVKGSDIKIGLISPMGQPIAYVVRGASIALRKEQAELILVKPKSTNNE